MVQDILNIKEYKIGQNMLYHFTLDYFNNKIGFCTYLRWYTSVDVYFSFPLHFTITYIFYQSS